MRTTMYWLNRCFNPKRFLLSLGALGAAAVALPVALVLAAVLSGTFVDDPAIFELDGNLTSGDFGGTRDWSNAALTASGLGPDVVTTTTPDPPSLAPAGYPYVIPDPAGQTIFTQGGSKDTLDVSNWMYTSGSVPDKDEITHAYAAAYSVNTGGGGSQPHTWIYFGADRFAQNGDSNIGFWFFQNSIRLGGSPTATKATPFTGVACPSGATNCLPGELHRNGDVLVVSAFTQGGAIGSILVFEWQSGALVLSATIPAPAECTPSSPSHVLGCAKINGASAVAAPPSWGYTPKTGSANSIPAGGHFEGGIDVTALFSGQAPCFASFLAETRSSQTDNAQLKDFVLGSFPECSVAITKACAPPPSFLSNPPRVHYSFTGNVTNDGGGNLFNLTVADTFPSGASNTSLLQPSTPAGGLASGASAPYSGSFEVSTDAEVINHVTASAAATSGGSNTVTSDHFGNPAAADAHFGVPGSACAISTNPSLSLTKSCVVSLVPGFGGVVLADDTTITVCNTSPDGTSTISNITLTNNVLLNGPGSGADFTVDSNFTLQPPGQPGDCQTYTPRYIPTQCAGGPPTLDGGRCEFDDTVRISSIPKDPFGRDLPPDRIPLPKSASCHVCPFGACTLQGTP